MGGHAAGEVASQLVIAALAHLDDDEPGGDLLSKLDSAVRQGNSAIAAPIKWIPPPRPVKRCEKWNSIYAKVPI